MIDEELFHHVHIHPVIRSCALNAILAKYRVVAEIHLALHMYSLRDGEVEDVELYRNIDYADANNTIVVTSGCPGRNFKENPECAVLTWGKED